LRATIAREREPLATALRQLERDVASRRADVERLRTLRYQKDVERQVVANDIAALEREVDFLFTVALEYRRSLETRVEAAEAQGLAADLEAID